MVWVSPRVRGFALFVREPVLEHLGLPRVRGFARQLGSMQGLMNTALLEVPPRVRGFALQAGQ